MTKLRKFSILLKHDNETRGARLSFCYARDQMKYLFLVNLFLVSFSSYAGCMEIGFYRDDKIDLYIGDGGCMHPVEIVISTYKNGQPNPGLIKRLEFDKECVLKTNELSCRENPENPLSQAKYRRIKNGIFSCQDWESTSYIYECIEHCGGKPKYLQEEQSCD